MPDGRAAEAERASEVPGGECDVLVVGGGPAGSTIAAALAQRGRDVVVLEKAQHPRFHIGESLLPANLPLFEQMGIAEDVHRIGLFKPGAEFVSDRYQKSNLFFFETATHLIASHSYHVRRAAFDQLLFENCRRHRARTFENTRVTEVAFPPGGRAAVSARGADGAVSVWRPRFVVDATGRDTLLASQLGLKTANKRNNTAAVFGHFRGVPRRAGAAEGVITIHLVEDGWFWMIPLPDGLMSVGLVGNPGLFKKRGSGIEDLFWSRVKASPSVSERMAGAVLTAPLATTGNYSYTAQRSAGERYLMIGDAFTFIDPIFSSGVMIAMTTGLLGAEAVDAFLADERRGRRALRRLERQVRQATGLLAWIIYRINDPVLRYLLMHPNNRFRLRDGLLSVLAGEIFGCSLATRFRVLAFRAIYYMLKFFRRVAPEPAGTAA